MSKYKKKEARGVEKELRVAFADLDGHGRLEVIMPILLPDDRHFDKYVGKKLNDEETDKVLPESTSFLRNKAEEKVRRVEVSYA